MGMTYLSRVLYLVFSTDHSSYKSLLRLQRQLVNKYVFLLPLAEKIMKKQSRSLSAIPYGCEAMPHAACEIDLKRACESVWESSSLCNYECSYVPNNGAQKLYYGEHS